MSEQTQGQQLQAETRKILVMELGSLVLQVVELQGVDAHKNKVIAELKAEIAKRDSGDAPGKE
jgi:hypothetical protein